MSALAKMGHKAGCYVLLYGWPEKVCQCGYRELESELSRLRKVEEAARAVLDADFVDDTDRPHEQRVDDAIDALRAALDGEAE